MKESWEIPHTRGVATLPVWALAPTFQLRKLTLAQHTANVNGLPDAAQGRDDKDLNLSDAQEAARDLFGKLGDLNVRIPGAIDNQIEDDDDLHGQLDKVYAVTPGQSEDSELRRARLVVGLWAAFNQAQAAQTPPEPALTAKVNGVTMTQASFETLIANCLVAQQSVATAQTALTDAKAALSALARKVDRDNKRWYGAWTKLYPAGTPEGDNARSNVPTEEGTPAPTPLEIESLTVQVDKRVAVMYAEQGGEHATTLQLQYQLPGEADFGHDADAVRRVHMAGPFAPGTLVRFRTHAGNSTDDQVFSAVAQVQIPA